MKKFGTGAGEVAGRTGAHLLVAALEAQGTDMVFGVPGESYLPVLDALHDSGIRFITCRQEGGAAIMAEAQGKLTGRPGICFVTRGPGATNASAGVHIAQQDATPMILFVGQVARDMRHRGAFQEVDYSAVFGSMTKWAVEIDNPARIPELVSRAFRVACQGRPGPVVIALPEDMLADIADAPDAPVAAPVDAFPDPAALADLAGRLARAERPVAILGGSGWTADTAATFTAFAQAHDIPLAVEFRRQMLVDATSEVYAGDLGFGANPALLRHVKGADLILLLGGTMGEVPSQGYELLTIPNPGTPLVHVYPGAEELGRVYQAALSILASPRAFVTAGLSPLSHSVPPARAAWRESARAAYRAWTDDVPANPGPVQMAEVVSALRALPSDSIMCNGAGNYAIWLHRFHRYRAYGTQLAPTSGSMGYGLPAAVGAKLQHPDRTVVALAGDGCFLMHGQEFATAVQHGAAIVAVVIDNGMYGTIRMHQEREFPGRVLGTQLFSPDFAALARAYGGVGFTVEKAGEFQAAFDAAIASGRPALVHVRLDPEAITPTSTLTGIREKALAG
ncbi:thiamine pyrophosphate-binding protein [Niveispirillum sp.]|uniref:thiamine pyrophosphate-binding protein n=1 Tax=Niveispirillum sp. TaxID=1917217 RepID=UPI0025F27453|nr:thiamine pyrophosphate-binding protein [Niveispirillum sp.]